MKWLAIIIDSIKGLKGGALCSTINSYALNGSQGIKEFILKLLKEASAPLLTMIKTWMIEGDLNDPYQEFFITMDPNVPDSKLWTDKHHIV